MKKIDLAEKIFLYLFFIYAVLSSNNITYGKSIISYVMWPTLALGLLLALYKVLKCKEYIKRPGLGYLIALLISIGTSTCINYQYDFKGNLIFCIYWALYFLVIYLMNTSKEIVLSFCKVFVSYATISALISIGMMHYGYSGEFTTLDTQYLYYAGFSIGRLWGVFINPNNGAITGAIAIIMLIYFSYNCKTVWKKNLLELDILLLLFFVALTDSRTGALCLGVVLAFFVLVLEWQKRVGIKRVALVALSLLILVLGFYMPRGAKDLHNYTAPKVNKIVASFSKDDANEPKEEPQKVERNYDTSGDISNRRFDAWKSAVEVYLSSVKVIAFGASYKGFTEYAREELPSTYIVNNDYADFTTLDNELFNIMDSQGTLGIISFVALIGFVLIFIVKYMFKTKDPCFAALIVALLFGLAGSACFCSVMFYHFSPNGILFWVILGGMVSIFGKEDKSWELT